MGLRDVRGNPLPSAFVGPARNPSEIIACILVFLIDLKEQVLNLQRQKLRNLSGVGSSDKMAECSQHSKESEITVNVVFSMKCMPSL